MEVSPRARLAWANRNIEAAADIIVADYLRQEAEYLGYNELSDLELRDMAANLDPEGATA